VLRRCPRCGGHGAWFTGWFSKLDRCRTCGYRYEREEGFMLGAVAMNTVITFLGILIVLVVGMIVTYPVIPLVPLISGCVAVAVIVPIVAFPITQTIWAAVELAMRPLAPAEEADAATYVAAGLADRAPRAGPPSASPGPSEPPA